MTVYLSREQDRRDGFFFLVFSTMSEKIVLFFFCVYEEVASQG